MATLPDWMKWDVLAYLKTNNIPIPESYGTNSGDCDLSVDSILYLHDHHPADYQRVLKWFPYVEAIIKRREWYNLPARTAKSQAGEAIGAGQ